MYPFSVMLLAISTLRCCHRSVWKGLQTTYGCHKVKYSEHHKLLRPYMKALLLLWDFRYSQLYFTSVVNPFFFFFFLTPFSSAFPVLSCSSCASDSMLIDRSCVTESANPPLPGSTSSAFSSRSRMSVLLDWKMKGIGLVMNLFWY